MVSSSSRTGDRWESRGAIRTILSQLQVAAEINTVADDAVRPSRKIHVADRTLRDQQTRQHLGHVVRSDAIAITSQQKGALNVEYISAREQKPLTLTLPK